MSDYPIGVGDVCLDLTQGRPVHVVEATGQTVQEWSDANDYDLADNYGNARCGTTADDMVFEVVYCSSAKSQPSKTYAMPEPRLMRIETEAADEGRPVYQRVVRDVLEDLFLDATNSVDPDAYEEFLHETALRNYGSTLVEEARELADVEQTIGGDDASK